MRIRRRCINPTFRWQSIPALSGSEDSFRSAAPSKAIKWTKDLRNLLVVVRCGEVSKLTILPYTK